MSSENNAGSTGYKKLVSNTLLFALGSFSSKMLIILLVSVYTNYLTRAELGVNDVIQQIANWLIPIVTLTISESVVRFGLDKTYDKKQVFSIANIACAAGLALLAVVLPIVTVTGAADKYLHNYSLLIFVYIFCASIKLVYSNFLRALDKVLLFAVTAIVNSALTLIGTILFIVVLRMGNAGYLWSIIAADALSTVFMMFSARLWRYIDFKHIDRKMLKLMISYSLPLIPAQIMWLITNSSDSFMTTHYLGPDRNGVLSASYKIANLVSTVYLMFGQAWNMSAIMEDKSKDRDRFYSNVFHLNQCLLYILSAGCLMICTPLTQIWMGKDVWESAMYAPILIYSCIFSCCTTFMGSIYLASNRTGRSLATSLVAGAINITLNVILIPKIGLFGPPITTVVSYVAVFAVRAYDSRTIVPFDLRLKKLLLNCSLLFVMMIVSVTQHTSELMHTAALFILPAMFAVILALNIQPVWKAVLTIAPAKISDILMRIGEKKLIAAGVAAAAFAVVCWYFHMVLTVTCLLVFAFAAAFGAMFGKDLVKLGGAAGIFLTLWASWGAAYGCLSLLVLLSLDYLRRPDALTSFLGCLCFIGTAWKIGGVRVGVFSGLVILLIAAAANFSKVVGLCERAYVRIKNR
ncbi:MAG: polysaccharide biosynthesis C-terminal domain-containing protein [Ruminococcus sp.]|nr:polysaccharide biosynthesis C-terminal domain-containing protein [Ruminococcus sp.]